MTTRKLFSIILFCFFSTIFISAQDKVVQIGNVDVLVVNEDVVNSGERPKIGLVLSGGGAKGAAHIGVLKVIREANIPIDYVAGTSMGSIVGGLFALGYSPEAIESLMEGLDWKKYLSDKIPSEAVSFQHKERKSKFLVDIPFDFKNKIDSVDVMNALPGGIVNGNNLENLLNALAVGYQGNIDFNKLPIPFACVATDMVTGEEVVFHNGELPTAIRASMSIPGLFTPVLLDDMVLVDGGILNNVPIDVCKAMGADIIITSMVGTKIRNDKSKLNSVIGIARNMLGVVTRKTNQQNIDQTDIYIEPDLAGVGMLNFDAESIDLMVRNGYASASEKRSEIEQVANLLKRWGDHSFQLQNEKAHYTDEQQYEINEVIITGVSEKDKEWLMRKSGLLWKKTISGLEMEEAIAIMYGTNFFDKVSYSIVNVPGTNKADIIMNYVFRKPHSVGLSFRIDSQEAASIGVMAGLNTHRMTAPKLEISAKLGYNPHATILASYSHRWMPKLNISASIRKSETDLNNFGKPYSHYKYIQQHHKIYFSEAYTRGWGIKAGIDFEQLIFSQSFTLTDYEALNPGYVGDPFLGAFAALNVDTRDNVQFPSKGVWMEFSGSWKFHDFKHPQGFNGFGDVVMKFKGYIPIGERFVLVPQFYSRSLIGNGYDQFNDLYDSPYENYMGGLLVGRYVEHQLPFIGINKPEVMYPNLGIFMGEGRVHIAGKHYVSVVASYAKESNTFMNMFKYPVIITDDDVDSMTSYHWWGAGLRYSLQLPVGPFLIDVAYSNNTKKVGVYASIGLDF